MAPKVFLTAFDRYTPRQQIGQGGTGFVVEAVASEGQTVAIKYLDPAKAHAKQRKRFQNEIKFGQRSPHENVISVLDFGQVEIGGQSAPFYVMPKFDHSLRQVMTSGLAPDAVLGVFGRILLGVEAAHLSGIWHRDLKPENILLSSDLARVVVADFGIAHFAELDYYTAAETQAADRLANYKYYAPEQIDSHQSQSRDHRIDIFSLGLILNELFTREIPRGSDPQLIRAVAPQFAYLDELVQMMTRQQPSARPASIRQIKSELTSRANIQLADQKFDKLRDVVVPNTEPTDAIIADPLTITGVNWQGGLLFLSFSGEAPSLWQTIFSAGNQVPISANSVPQIGRWASSTAFVVRANGDEAQRVLDQYKAHTLRVNQDYVARVRRDHAESQSALRQKLANDAKAAAEQARVLKTLKL